MEKIADDILEQAKGLNFSSRIRRIPTNAQGNDEKLRGKGVIKELLQAVAPQFKEKWPPIILEYLFAAIAHHGKPADEWGNLILVRPR